MTFHEDKPIYLQITESIMDSIISREYPPDSRLPSVREYAAKVEVNANTVMRSYDWLQHHSIIFNKRGIGFFVLPEARRIIIEMRREKFFKEEADYFFNRLVSFGFSPNEVAGLYKNFLENKTLSIPNTKTDSI